MGMFDLKEVTSPSAMAKIHVANFNSRNYLKIQNVESCVKRLPQKNEIFFIETEGSFNAFNFIEFVQKISDVIEHLFIATFTINERNLNMIHSLYLTGKIKRVHLDLSETIQYRFPAIEALLKSLQAKGVLSYTMMWIHRKVTAMRTKSDCFVLEGSGNYGENTHREQYIFANDEALYRFRTAERWDT